MKYRLFYVALSLATLLAVTAYLATCGNDSKKQGWGGETNPRVEQLDETPDSAIAVILRDFDADSIYVKVKDTGKEKAYSYQDAKANGNFKGTLERGNIYSIFPESRYKKVIIAINVSELGCHDWIYDTKQYRGISFNAKGGMTSINAEDICFREWKLLNGKLYIYYVDLQQKADDRHGYLVEEADITELGKERLTMLFMGKTYYCKKPSPQPIRLGE